MKKGDIIDCIKAARKAAREEEIALYGKTLCYAKVEKSKKAYSRKIKHKNCGLYW